MIENPEIKQLLKEVLDEKLAPLYIDKQQHYADHLKIQKMEDSDITFIAELRKFIISLKDTFWKTFIRVIVIASLSLITGGLFAYFKYHGKN